MFSYHKRDLCSPCFEEGDNLILHVVNNVGKFAKGVAASIARDYPSAKRDYENWMRYSKPELGSISVSFCKRGAWNFSIVHLLAQGGLPSKNNPHPCDVDKLAVCLDTVSRLAAGSDVPVTFHIPKLGCGYGGATWDVVEHIVSEHLVGGEIHVYEV